eukprot:1376933-Amphidinium_carterae.2
MEKTVQEGGKVGRKQESRRMLYGYANKISGIPRSALTLKKIRILRNFGPLDSKVYDTNWDDKVALQKVLAEMLGSIPEESELEAIAAIPKVDGESLLAMGKKMKNTSADMDGMLSTSSSLIPKTPFASMANNFRPIAIANAFERFMDLYLLTHLKRIPFSGTHTNMHERGNNQWRP